ncbi:MAG: toprim domain-containing protein [Acidobacteria bacterium ACB2]|nr:toprim domain-containing protein [Acidobacteria bacterium ACB2]
MPRIPDELIERIKREVLVRTLAERAGVELRSHGENLLGRCLWHVDKTPSLVLTPAKNLWHCMGACQAGGSPIDWVMKAEGVSFRAAVEILLAEFFPLEASRLSPVKRSTVPKLPSPVEVEATDAETLRQVVGFYHATLEQTPDALDYLKGRGIRSAETIERFKLGFSDRTLGLRLPLMNRKAGYEIRTRLQRLGIYRKSAREHFVGCVTVPVFDEDGDVGEIYGRRIEAHLPAGTPKHLYRGGPHRGVFNLEAFAASKEIVLCEALLDALKAWEEGFRNVTSSFGTEGVTEELLDTFVRHGTEKVLVAFDRDEAGDKGAKKVAEKLMARGVDCYRVLFPRGMDLSEYALKVQPASQALGVLFRSAEWMGNGRPPAHASSYVTPNVAGHDARAGSVAVVAPPAEAANEAAPRLAATVERAERGEGTREPGTSEEGDRAAKEGISGSPGLEPVPEASPASRVDRFAQDGAHVDASARARQVLEQASEASPAPPPALNGDDEALFRFDDRSYRIRGLKKALQSGSLHVTVRAQRHGDLFAPPSPISGWFLDKFDFISSRQRALFEKQAAQEMGVKPEVVKWDLGQVVRALEELQEKARLEALKPKTAVPLMTDEDRAEGLEYASAEDLVERILRDYETCGVVGEKTNALLGYLGTISRLSERPLAIIVRSSSAAGKSALMEAILRFVPAEAREKYSALSGHALFYFEGKDFKHKVLAIVEEEGAQRASYALKLLQSEGEITIASTGKDPGTGRLVTKEYRVEGPVMIFLTSTAVEIDEELLNRALVLTVDEGREQTRAIHRLQREAQTLEGLWAREEREEVYRGHHNLQRLLEPLPVVNPYVRDLTFLDDRTRTRRDHTKYLGLIEAITLLHQYQRPRKRDTRGTRTKDYVEATLEDVALANRIAAEVLGRSLDELPPQTRRLLLSLDDMVRGIAEVQGADRSDVRFTLRDVRAFSGLSHDQLWRHMQRLVTLEYVLVHKGGRGQTFVYELLYDGQGKDGTPFLIGLADVEALAKAHGLPVPRAILPPLPRHEAMEDAPTTPTSAGEKATSAGVSRVHLGAFRVGSAGALSGRKRAPGAARDDSSAKNPENAHQGVEPRTYAQGGRTHAPVNGHPPRLLVNLLRFAPLPPSAPPPGNGDRLHRHLLMRRARSGF